MPFEIVRNDITKMETDAIVNAANTSLLGGGGVDGAIHAAAGPELLEECRGLGGCPVGEARITKGYRLKARYVIHTVGPVWQGGSHGERELLASCFARSLKLAKAYGCESVAFPMISAGVYGYPGEKVMEVAVEEISRFLLQNDMTVYLVVFGRESFAAGRKLFRDVQAYIDDTYVEEHLDFRRESRRYQAYHSEMNLPDVLPAAGKMPEKKTEGKKLWDRIRGRTGAVREETAPRESVREEMVDSALAPETFGGAADLEEMPDSASAPEPFGGAADLEEMLRNRDEGFQQMLLRLIDERGMTDAECYKKANVDRKLFSKIRTKADYHPSKPTVLAFAVALELDLPETRALMERAGFALTHSSRFDIILEYFIRNRQYNVFVINEVLFEYDLPLLGNGGAA